MAATVTAVAPRLADTADAFDSVAADYDGPQGNNELIQRMRDLTWARIDALLDPSSTLLDIGCGTGIDAERFASLGHRVVATDWSPEMVARAAARSARVAGRIEAVHLGAHELGRLLASHLGSVDVAYSNFGPLNCVPDLAAVGRAAADLVRPGGHAVFTVIGRLCPWEIAHYARERSWSRVAVRYRRGMTAVGMNGHTIWTRYHTPGGFVREWTRGSSAWESVRVEGLSTFVPPPYLAGTPAARPDRLVRLERLDAATSAWPVMRSIGDHFLVVLRRA
jgi:SAM-dependent methyltransferase